MEILDKLQTKVRNAVQKIEELQAKVSELQAKNAELEEIKRQYEEKMANLVNELGDDDSLSQQSTGSGEADRSEEGQSQEGLYRHQF